MTNQSPDRDLRELFRELRSEDRNQVPDFQDMMARVHEEISQIAPGPQVLRDPPAEGPAAERIARRPVTRRLAWSGSILAAACAATLLLIQLPESPDAEFERVVQSFSADPASGAWTSPTDALLDLPGAELLSTIPSIGNRPWPLPAGDDPRGNEL